MQVHINCVYHYFHAWHIQREIFIFHIRQLPLLCLEISMGLTFRSLFSDSTMKRAHSYQEVSEDNDVYI